MNKRRSRNKLHKFPRFVSLIGDQVRVIDEDSPVFGMIGELVSRSKNNCTIRIDDELRKFSTHKLEAIS